MIIVCGLSKAQGQIDQHGARSVIGILGPETAHPVYSGVDEARHLRLSFNDINEPTEGMVHASEDDVHRLIRFIQEWDRKAPMVVHCWAGISRSTATAFTAMCLLRPDEDEMALAQDLREASPSATPNRLITAKVDQVLGRQGRMLRAVESIGRGADAYEGVPFAIKV
ncbi:tyrosine phosphatase family protein [Aestuariivirga litoralis]|uniref:tyrosine phosphatase family protein n=1 Tax=Aestuariivirga litoralis TaxID=2650924 RepID=UPI0018C7BC84|nr:protein-tyrosine phosphatase family protein [Aestuariivirga litoralis]MBG1230833.1 tyrosine protein phosphatase [Aestuariivirga litoralis]